MEIYDYIYRLEYAIWWFEAKYNKFPERIIMSSALASYISGDMEMYIRRSDGMIGYFHGIPMMIYVSDELECHLVEKNNTYRLTIQN